jgi:hypothetical protein
MFKIQPIPNKDVNVMLQNCMISAISEDMEKTARFLKENSFLS